MNFRRKLCDKIKSNMVKRRGFGFLYSYYISFDSLCSSAFRCVVFKSQFLILKIPESYVKISFSLL